MWRYPDNVGLDAVDGPDGRPARLAMQAVIVNLGVSVREYAIFQRGTKRINLTRRMTAATLTEFRNCVKQNAVPGCNCREYFGINK